MDKEERKKTICTIPWTHTAVYQNGEYGICCMCVYNSGGRLFTGDKPESVMENDIDTVRNHPTYVELRKSMLAGEQHELCKLCWDEEALGGRHSKRQGQQHIYRDTLEKILEIGDPTGHIDVNEFPIQYLDLRLGNLCNLACRSCGPDNSSLWLEYLGFKQFTVGGRPGTYNISNENKVYKIVEEDFNYWKSDKFDEFLVRVLPTVNRIYFTGGEPLINKRHYQILDYCIEKGFAKNIELEYNTNGTTLNMNLLNQWREFKFVDVCFSIDAMGPLANYVRYPTDWDVIERNMRMFDDIDIPHLRGSTNATISIFNIMHLPEFFTWFHKQKFKKFKRNLCWHRLVFPKIYNVQILPAETKKMITEYYDNFIANSDIPDLKHNIYNIITFMNQEDQSIRMPEFRIMVDRQDRLRNQNVRDEVPWLGELLDSPSSWLI